MCVLATVYSGRLAQISDLVGEGSCEVGVESNLYQVFIALIRMTEMTEKMHEVVTEKR